MLVVPTQPHIKCGSGLWYLLASGAGLTSEINDTNGWEKKDTIALGLGFDNFVDLRQGVVISKVSLVWI